MRCASALSTERATDVAFREVLDRVGERLGGETADLAVVFASTQHGQSLGELSASIRERGLGRHVLGCTGESIAGDSYEIEDAPAVCLWAIRWPGVTLRLLRLQFEENGFAGWPDDLLSGASEGRAVLVLGDPFSFPADRWLRHINESAPGLRLIGGMASAGRQPGENRLILDEQVFEDGAVAVWLDGPGVIRTVVSQGCRPIGRHFVVTRTERNLIRELGRRPALEAFRETYEALDEDEQELVRNGLHLGRVINEYQETFHRGDFLVRNVLGADDAGGLAITDTLRVGQTVQFHVRDAATADEDLRSLLDDESTARDSRPAGALLFTCNGRGTRLFPEPNHDVGVIRDIFGPIPVAGFFAMGEIGPVGGQNFLHGFTASIALFEELSHAGRPGA